MNLAIISPNENSYSESFIQAHKRLRATIFFYYGGLIPEKLEGIGALDKVRNPYLRIIKKVLIKILYFNHPYQEIIFRKSLVKNKIHILFAEYGTTGVAVLDICKKLNIKLVPIFHGFDAYRTDIVEYYKSNYTKLFNYSASIVVVSNAMRNQLIDLGCNSDKLVVTPCGPNEKFFEVNPTFSEEKSLISIGRFVDKKAPYYNILCIKKIAETIPDIKLYYAGDGPLFNVVLDLVRYFKLEKNVILLGAISHDTIIEIYKKVSVFIQHSIVPQSGDSEGTPVSILEASASGLPVVSTFHAGIPDVIIDGVTGFLVNEHEVDEMAKKIIVLLNDIDLARKMGNAGRENIRKHFSLQAHLNTLESVLGIKIVNS